MNWARGFKRIILLMAIAAATVGGICMVVIPVRKYCNAQHQPWVSDPLVVKKPSEQEVKEFDKWVQEMATKGTIIDLNCYYVIEGEADSLEQSLPSLKEIRPFLLKDRNVLFWRNLSKLKLVGICILAGLAGASAAFLSVWFVFWFGGLAVYRVTKWAVLGFCDEKLKS